MRYWTGSNVPLKFCGWDVPFFGLSSPHINDDAQVIAETRRFIRLLRPRAEANRHSLFDQFENLAAREKACRDKKCGRDLLTELQEISESVHTSRPTDEDLLQEREKGLKRRQRRISWCRTAEMLKLRKEAFASMEDTQLGRKRCNLIKAIENKEGAEGKMKKEMRKKEGTAKDSPEWRARMKLVIDERKQQCDQQRQELIKLEQDLSEIDKFKTWHRTDQILKQLDRKFGLLETHGNIVQHWKESGRSGNARGTSFEDRGSSVHLPPLLHVLRRCDATLVQKLQTAAAATQDSEECALGSRVISRVIAEIVARQRSSQHATRSTVTVPRNSAGTDQGRWQKPLVARLRAQLRAEEEEHLLLWWYLRCKDMQKTNRSKEWNAFCCKHDVPNILLMLNAKLWCTRGGKQPRQDGEVDALLYDASTMRILLWVEQKASSCDLAKADKQRRSFFEMMVREGGWVGGKMEKTFTAKSLSLFRGSGDEWDGGPHKRCVIMTQCAALLSEHAAAAAAAAAAGGAADDGNGTVLKVVLPGPVRHLALPMLWNVDVADHAQLLDAGHSLCSAAKKEAPFGSAQDILAAHARAGAAGSILVFPPL